MPPRAYGRCDPRSPVLAILALLVLCGCSSTGDFGRLHPDLVSDDIHAWVGRDAARMAGAPVSVNNLTDEERTLRDLAFPLIEPPYDRQRWDAVIYEYGINRLFRRDQWAVANPTKYYAHLQGGYRRSTASRYNQLIDDIRNDFVRIEPFFATARHVLDLDRRRQASMQHVADLSPPESLSALARIGENSLTVAWVQHSLTERCASYRFALEHLAVAEPEPIAADADRALTQLKQAIDANQVVVVPLHFAAAPGMARQVLAAR
jgi:hypothetical protein